MRNSEESKSILDEKPPFFKNWKQIYLLVIGVLFVMILLFYLFTVRFS